MLSVGQPQLVGTGGLGAAWSRRAQRHRLLFAELS